MGFGEENYRSKSALLIMSHQRLHAVNMIYHGDVNFDHLAESVFARFLWKLDFTKSNTP